ncbi:MAG: hypothetical protein PSV46_04195 [Reyranella sp.]|nr:hypothetical protein [Reyranella sp.]
MISKLTMMHGLLAVGACGSIYLAIREVQRRYISQWRLLAPATLGLGVALGLAIIQIAARQPGWPFIVALLAGLAAGWLRGTLMRIEHDMHRPTVAVSRAAKLVLVWVALAVGAAVAVEIGAAGMDPRPEAVRFGAALVAMLGAAAMQGRALALAVRLHRHFLPREKPPMMPRTSHRVNRRKP